MGVVELSVKGTGIFTGFIIWSQRSGPGSSPCKMGHFPSSCRVRISCGPGCRNCLSSFKANKMEGSNIIIPVISLSGLYGIRCQCHACRHNGGLYSHGKVDRASNEGHSGGEPGSCMLASVEALVCMGRRLEIIGAFGLGHRVY